MNIETVKFYHGTIIVKYQMTYSNGRTRKWYGVNPIKAEELYYPDSDDVKPLYDYEFTSIKKAELAVRTW